MVDVVRFLVIMVILVIFAAIKLRCDHPTGLLMTTIKLLQYDRTSSFSPSIYYSIPNPIRIYS